MVVTTFGKESQHGSVKPRRPGETQWGAFVEAPERKNVGNNQDLSHAPISALNGTRPSHPDNADWSPNENQDQGAENNGLTPYLEIRERLQRGMYELVYDKPCVRSSMSTRDSSRAVTLKPVRQE